MFPFVSSFLINPLHNCHLSFSKSDFGEIWPKAGEAKKLNLKFIALLKFNFADYLRMTFLPDILFFSKDQLSQFHNQGQFLCFATSVLAFCPNSSFFWQRQASDGFEQPPIRGNFGFAKLPPLSANLSRCVSFLDCSSSVAPLKY